MLFKLTILQKKRNSISITLPTLRQKARNNALSSLSLLSTCIKHLVIFHNLSHKKLYSSMNTTLQYANRWESTHKTCQKNTILLQSQQQNTFLTMSLSISYRQDNSYPRNLNLTCSQLSINFKKSCNLSSRNNASKQLTKSPKTCQLESVIYPNCLTTILAVSITSEPFYNCISKSLVKPWLMLTKRYKRVKTTFQNIFT